MTFLLLLLFVTIQAVDHYAWHGLSLTQHTAQHTLRYGQGYRYKSLSIHGDPLDPRYTAVVVRSSPVTQAVYWNLRGPQAWQAAFDYQAGRGFGPVLVVATGGASDATFAAVFESQGYIPLTRHGLISGSDTDPSTIQYWNKKAQSDGTIPSWLAVYGSAGSPRYIGIWKSNPGLVTWNADGVYDTGADYQARFNAQTSAWCRPALVTLNGDNHYLSLFVDNEIGPWIARHGMTSSDYQSEFDKYFKEGFYPITVQGGGTGSNTRYAAIWAKSTTPVAKIFTTSSPNARAAIDNVVKKGLQGSPVKHASLAIVFQDRLVYTAGYTWGEPGWPLAHPTTYFRQASVSKTVVALGIYQLLETGALLLTDKMQTILNLKTPSGTAPTDSRFSTITVQHLLEHKSGLNPNAFWNDIAVLNAHKAAHPSGSWNLPVTEQMIDSYTASLALKYDPGSVSEYNNCGYYLLGRILAKKRNAASPMSALQQYLFTPLNITRIRRSSENLATMPSNEARYRGENIPVGPSVLDNARPLVPDTYGNLGLGTRIGMGALSGAAPDMARLVSLCITKNDTAGVLLRSTVRKYLDRAVVVGQGGRAGYGFDAVASLGNDQYYAQKGGSLSTSGNVFEFRGDWGFVMHWAGKASAATGWYPDYPEVMNIAKGINWGTTDLFPLYGL